MPLILTPCRRVQRDISALLLLLLVLLLRDSRAFAPSFQAAARVGVYTSKAHVTEDPLTDDGKKDTTSATTLNSRREALRFIGSIPAALVTVSTSRAEDTVVANGKKILVLGGTGFVGSRVVEQLRGLGITTVATSRDGRDGTTALDFSKQTAGQIQDAIANICRDGTCQAIISCVGAIGTDQDQVVNAGTGIAAQAAKKAGVKKFVYITVAPEVKEFAEGIEFLKGYMDGKSFSRSAVLSAFPDDASVLIEPTFIYGGGSFELNPPRVASFYGQFIEGLLSSGPVRSVERVLSPGIIKIALEPPVPVEDVAAAAVAGALGKTKPILDSYDKIKQAANELS